MSYIYIVEGGADYIDTLSTYVLGVYTDHAEACQERDKYNTWLKNDKIKYTEEEIKYFEKYEDDYFDQLEVMTPELEAYDRWRSRNYSELLPATVKEHELNKPIFYEY